MSPASERGDASWSPQGAVTELTESASWTLLERATLGRLAVSERDVPHLYPVNFVCDQQTILFRSANGDKLRQLEGNPSVAFEVDGEVDRGAWSVTVEGLASALDAGPELTPREIEKFPPWAPIEPYVFVRIEPLSIRGRQWEPHRAIERD
jgi:nitroimidazol reductase NimA-like FMN-containing flavoprotein (pyridoxamine 5'-phosphate oxidase superfamily)